MNSAKRMLVCFAVIAAAVAAQARPGGGPPPPHGGHHHHHGSHHDREILAIGAGILGAGILADALFDRQPAPVYVQPAPVVVSPAPAVVVQPAPVVVQPAPVVVQPRTETRVQNVWVEGRYVDAVQANGTILRTWQPGHYEQQTVTVTVP